MTTAGYTRCRSDDGSNERIHEEKGGQFDHRPTSTADNTATSCSAVQDWITSSMPNNKARSPGQSINNNPPRTKAITTGATVDIIDARLSFSLIGKFPMMSILLWFTPHPTSANLNVTQPVHPGGTTTWAHESSIR